MFALDRVEKGYSLLSSLFSWLCPFWKHFRTGNDRPFQQGYRHKQNTFVLFTFFASRCHYLDLLHVLYFLYSVQVSSSSCSSYDILRRLYTFYGYLNLLIKHSITNVSPIMQDTNVCGAKGCGTQPGREHTHTMWHNIVYIIIGLTEVFVDSTYRHCWLKCY